VQATAVRRSHSSCYYYYYYERSIESTLRNETFCLYCSSRV